MYREDEAFGGSLPAKAVACTGGKENHRSGSRALDPVPALGPPLHTFVAAGLQMEAELAVLVLGDLDGGDGVALQNDTIPGLLSGLPGKRRQQRDNLVVPQYGDPA
jgi:hypothetical protein